MKRLWLKFTDESGTEQRVEVDRATFTVGRHSACDLTVPDSRLSREHLRLESEGDHYTATDPGSSNGTILNGSRLRGTAVLRDGDVLDLGGALEVAIEVEAADNSPSEAFAETPAADGSAAESYPYAPLPPGVATSPAAEPGEGIPTAVFIIAPLMAILVLAVVVGAIVLFRGGEKEVASNPRETDSTSEEIDESDPDEPTPKPRATASPTEVDGPSNRDPLSTTPGNSSGTPPPAGNNGDDVSAVERNAAEFLKQAAKKDSSPFITSDQAGRVKAKIKQISSWQALAENLKSARQGAAKIRSAAGARNLKPGFLAVAAITKLGNSRGDVPQTVESIADVYDRLSIPIGGSLGDDALLLVAAYEQGSAGEFTKLQLMLQNLANAPGAPPTREIRTVWYLEKAGKLAPGDFDRALTFLAIGTIAQNPKAFGVNAEALKL